MKIYNHVWSGFEAFTAVSMKVGVFWDIKPSLYFREDTSHLHYRAQPVNALQDLKVSRR
jgi:hypothetical protein